MPETQDEHAKKPAEATEEPKSLHDRVLETDLNKAVGMGERGPKREVPPKKK